MRILSLATLALFAPAVAIAQAFPAKPTRIVVGSSRASCAR